MSSMKKLAAFLSLLCVINILALAGLVGFLLTTGRLDKPKAQSISDLLRHQGTPENLRGKLYDILAPAAQTQPATTTAPAPVASASDVPGSAQERIDYVRRVLEQDRLELENEKQFLRDQHKLLDQRQESLAAAEAAFAQQKKVYEQKLATADTTTDKAGFQRSLAIFDELKPKQVKDLLLAMTPDDIARYFTAMQSDRAAKIMAEFKSADEKSLLNTVLDKIRGVKPPSGTGAAPAPPAAPPSLSAASAGRGGRVAP
jgi:flagellar motility protein MotE (MotC chaperone)